jgi:hypothetical protein
VSTHRAVHLIKVILNNPRQLGMCPPDAQKTRCSAGGIDPDLMDHLVEVDLHGLRGNEAVVAKIAGFVLLVMVWILSSFFDNIAGALIGGAMAHQLFRAKVHIGYLAAIVAASNAGGAWSVLGDTTTTMMWIAGISPARVFPAIIASTVALFIFGIPAAIQQHKHLPILRGAHPHTHVDWTRVGIVGIILGLAIGTNVTVNMRIHRAVRSLSVYWDGGFGGDSAIHSSAPTGLGSAARSIQGLHFSAIARVMCFDDARGEVTAAILGNGVGSWISLCRVRQHSAYGVGAEAGRFRLGLSCLYRRFWRLHDLVWIIVGGGAIQYVSRSKIRREMRHGWYIPVAYVIGFFVMLVVRKWHPDAPH